MYLPSTYHLRQLRSMLNSNIGIVTQDGTQIQLIGQVLQMYCLRQACSKFKLGIKRSNYSGSPIKNLYFMYVARIILNGMSETLLCLRDGELSQSLIQYQHRLFD